jgi:hypothetical protein
MIQLSTKAKEAIKTGLAFTLVYGIALKSGWMNPYWAGFAVAEAPERPCPSRPLYGLIDRLADDAGVSDVGLKVGARTRI